MLNVTLYVPGVSPGIVPGAFHDCPGRPSISTAAPMGTEDTINCASAGAGGAAGAGAFLGALTVRKDACAGALVAALLSWLNGAGALTAGLAGVGAAALSAAGSLGRRCNSKASATITTSTPTTAPTNFH